VGEVFLQVFLRRFGLSRLSCASAFLAALLFASTLPVAARAKDTTDYGTGLVVNVPLPESEVAPVVSEVAQNGIIRGTKEYNKDDYIRGADAAASSNLFPAWIDGGKVFYKVKKQALDPRNFKESNDVGTIAVRYVVQPQGEKNTVVRIDAMFVEDFRHTVHASNGTVESSEYKVIQDHLDSIELMKKQAAEVEQERQERLSKKNFGIGGESPTLGITSDSPNAALLPGGKEPDRELRSAVTAQTDETLEQHVANLRHELERLVKAPGAPLKSAPFHSAGTLKTLPSGTEVLIVITTPYWFGVETRDGQHGWLLREQLELLP
jgi:hypothetical protein